MLKSQPRLRLVAIVVVGCFFALLLVLQEPVLEPPPSSPSDEGSQQPFEVFSSSSVPSSAHPHSVPFPPPSTSRPSSQLDTDDAAGSGFDPAFAKKVVQQQLVDSDDVVGKGAVARVSPNKIAQLDGSPFGSTVLDSSSLSATDEACAMECLPFRHRVVQPDGTRRVMHEDAASIRTALQRLLPHSPFSSSGLFGSSEDTSYRLDCPVEPVHVGNFSDRENLLLFADLPTSDPWLDVLSERMRAERAQYWADHEAQDPFFMLPRGCKFWAAQKVMYRVRRWWRVVRLWSSKQAKISGTFVGVHRGHFETRKGHVTSDVSFEARNPNDVTVSFEQIAHVVLCEHKDDLLVALVGREGELLLGMKHVFPEPGMHCFVRTLLMLFPEELYPRVVRSNGERCPQNGDFPQEFLRRAAPVSQTTSPPLVAQLPALPTFRNDVTNLTLVAITTGGVGQIGRAHV